MNVMKKVWSTARKRRGSVVLFEGWDERVVEGGCRAAAEDLAAVIILGNREDIGAIARKRDVSLNQVTVADHLDHQSRLREYARCYIDIRKAEGKKTPSLQRALSFMQLPHFYAAMMVHTGAADGYLGGADTSTAETLRPALHIIGCAETGGLATSYFIMVHPDPRWGENGVLIFGDCAIVIEPTSEQLARIGVTVTQAARDLLGFDPRVAFLSFSTRGSADHRAAGKVALAAAKARELGPDIIFEGELQGDAALVEEVARKKYPDGLLAGRANVLIFPNLDAGNIAYKLVQRLAGTEAFGPIVAGLKKPVNDLSRGCSVDDVMNMVAITSAMT